MSIRRAKGHSSSWVVLHFSNDATNCRAIIAESGVCSKNMYKLRCAVEFVVGIDGIGSELSLGLSWRGEYCS